MRQSIIIGLAVVTVPVALAALFLPSGGNSSGRAVPSERVFPGLQAALGTAAKLTVVGPDGTVTLERKAATDAAKSAIPADGWTLPAKGGYPVQPGTIRPILAGLSSLRTVSAATAQPKLYDRLELNTPGKGSEAHEVTLADAAGHDLAKLIVGKHSDAPASQSDPTQSEGSFYIRKTDQPQTWLARPAFSLPSGDLEWIDKKILDIDSDTVKDIRLTPADGKPLELSREKPADPLAVKDLPKDTKLKSDNPSNDIAAAFRYLDLDDVKPAAEITAKPVATAHLETFDGLSADLTLIKQDNATWVTVAATGADKAQKAADDITARTKGWAYKLADDRATTLQSKLADLEPPPEPTAPKGMPKPPGMMPPGMPGMAAPKPIRAPAPKPLPGQ